MQMIADHPNIERAEITGYPTEEFEAVYHCCCCEEGIFEGDAYYEIEGGIYCEECLNIEFRKLA